MFLKDLGADASFSGAFEPYAAQGLIPGRVAMSNRDQYRLYTAEGEFAAEPSGLLWYRAAERAAMPVVGDWVAARVVGPEDAIVEAVLPRRTCFSRRAAGRREEEQPLAANIDLVFLVCGLDGDFNLRRLERYLTLTVESGAQAVVILNKTDLCPDLPGRMAQTAAVARDTPILPVSARDEEGLGALGAFLQPGRTVALLGSSGVGKSTILNRLMGSELQRTTAVRESDSRGRHTTTHRELVPLPQGCALIDTPGLRELQLWASEESVTATFEEIANAAGSCRYRDCTHAGEPGCGVAKAVAAGAIAVDRVESYQKLRREARRHELMADPVAARQEKQKLKAVFRSFRTHEKFRR